MIEENHRITEHPKLEGTYEDHGVQLLAPCSTTQNSNPTSEGIIQMLLQLQQFGAVITALGSLVQCSAVLWLCGAVSTEFYTEILSKCLVVNCAINLQPQSIIQRLYYE